MKAFDRKKEDKEEEAKDVNKPKMIQLGARRATSLFLKTYAAEDKCEGRDLCVWKGNFHHIISGYRFMLYRSDTKFVT